MDDKGIVTRVEYSYQKGIYNVYLRGINGKLFCYGPSEMDNKDFYFKTKDPSYHVGDTVKFIM